MNLAHMRNGCIPFIMFSEFVFSNMFVVHGFPAEIHMLG